MTNQFLDTSVIIGYSGLLSVEKLEGGEKIFKICADFVKNKEGKFVVCCFTIEKEIASLIVRQKVWLNEIKKKIDDTNYEIGSSTNAKALYPEDINRAKKVYSYYSLNIDKTNKEGFKKNLSVIRAGIEARISFFLERLIDERVIPRNQIKKPLVNILREFIGNYADCNVFASVLQYTTSKSEKIIFITLDKRDFDENGITFLKDEPRLQSYKFPELKILG